MPPARLERARPVRAQALNLPCIPIPPRGQYGYDYNHFAVFVKRLWHGWCKAAGVVCQPLGTVVYWRALHIRRRDRVV